MLLRRFLALALSLAALPAVAQSFPDRPIRLIVPVGPGGGTDVFARKLIGGSLGQPIIVDNRAGGSGTIGTQAVIDARPDGHTLGFVWNTPLTAAPHTLGARYTLDSYTPVMRVGYSPFVICAQPDFPATNLQEMIANIRANPGRYTWGNEGMGGVMHLGVERIWRHLGLDLTAVPFQGAGQTLPAFLGRHITFYGGSLTGAMPAVRADTAKCLMLTTAEASPAAPGSAGLSSIGLSEMEVTIWWGLIAPRDMPADRLERIRDAFVTAARQPQFAELMASQAAVMRIDTGEELSRSIRAEHEALGTIARELNLLK
ncbi:tripartite tricarboxylate transporter substrate binding protein [Sabulicella rubraurantiaca]|uniref:tripartite tricarboxylate transporter substrate binding protein n=1 Tax=Sabulicella rubraurantiaca TaxID=2811429 RepID=UPI001A9793C4|nr:tripartite tricarboxylate transporter substrate binding protein [Sabulicella rubraurantiaca]